jgi:hypothetical protein
MHTRDQAREFFYVGPRAARGFALASAVQTWARSRRCHGNLTFPKQYSMALFAKVRKPQARFRGPVAVEKSWIEQVIAGGFHRKSPLVAALQCIDPRFVPLIEPLRDAGCVGDVAPDTI